VLGIPARTLRSAPNRFFGDKPTERRLLADCCWMRPRLEFPDSRRSPRKIDRPEAAGAACPESTLTSRYRSAWGCSLYRPSKRCIGALAVRFSVEIRQPYGVTKPCLVGRAEARNVIG